jgi:hypothetical protein
MFNGDNDNAVEGIIYDEKSVIIVLIILTIITLLIVEVPGYQCTYTIGLCTYGVRYIRPYIMYLLIYVPHMYEYLRMYLVVSCNPGHNRAEEARSDRLSLLTKNCPQIKLWLLIRSRGHACFGSLDLWFFCSAADASSRRRPLDAARDAPPELPLAVCCFFSSFFSSKFPPPIVPFRCSSRSLLLSGPRGQ